MAEFQEVAEQKRRMCKMYDKNDCNGCPLKNGDCGVLNMRFTDVDTVRRVENTVMAWAEENPEPLYPTWWSWLINEGVIEKGSTYTGAFGQLRTKSIPTDIAQKLGIEPKNG